MTDAQPSTTSQWIRTNALAAGVEQTQRRAAEQHATQLQAEVPSRRAAAECRDQDLVGALTAGGFAPAPTNPQADQ